MVTAKTEPKHMTQDSEEQIQSQYLLMTRWNKGAVGGWGAGESQSPMRWGDGSRWVSSGVMAEPQG